MKRLKRLYRVITFLKREELDFLDNLVKDIYFTYGVKIPRAKVIEEVIAEFKDNASENKKELIVKILETVGTKIERRKYPRLKRHLHIEFRKMDSMKEYKACVTDNIGMGGFRMDVVSLGKPLSVGQLLELSIKDPEQKTEPIKAIGRIAWIREREDRHDVEVGVMLTYIKKEDKARFTNYLSN